MNNIPFIRIDDTITLFIEHEPFIVEATDPNFRTILSALQTKDSTFPFGRYFNTFKYAKQILKETYFRLETEPFLYYKDYLLQPYSFNALLQAIREGRSFTRIARFLDALLANPSFSVVQSLETFLQQHQLPLTPAGTFLAYKRVTEDYKDIHTQTIDNSIGRIVRMDRNQVNDNPANGCSNGLHAAAFAYLRKFEGDRTVVIEISPTDVVCIPEPVSSTEKIRVCEYKVLYEVHNNLNLPLWRSSPPFADTQCPTTAFCHP